MPDLAAGLMRRRARKAMMELRVALGLLPPVLLVAVSSHAESRPGYEYVSPMPGSGLVSPWNSIAIRPGAPLGAAVSETASLSVIGSASGSHAGRLVRSDDGRTLVFNPARPFALGERVEVRLDAAVRDRNGTILPPLVFDFTVARADPMRQPRLSLAQLLEDEPGFQADRRHPSRAATRGATPLAVPGGTLANDCGKLPRDYLAVVLKKSANPDPGAVFMAPFAGSQSAGRLLILDNAAEPLFYRRLPTLAFDFKMQPSGLLTYFSGDRFWGLDSSYAVVDSFRVGNGYATDVHELQILPNRHALLMAYDVEPVHMDSIVPGGRRDAQVVGLIVQEIDQAKNVVFQWRSWDHFHITDADSCVINLRDSLVDYVHGNAIELDRDGNLLISSRSMNEITKVDRSTGAVIWRLGLKARRNQFRFLNDSRGFTAQHDVRRLPNGHITLFDNGNCQPPLHSRAIEYQLYETNKVAVLVWEYRNAPDSYGAFMGNVQRRSNGGTMIGWGGTATDPKLTDLHADGTEGLELGLTFSVDWTYRAFRFPWSAATFAVTPDTTDFGTLVLGGSATRMVWVRNRSNALITITCVRPSDPAVSVWSPVPFSIGPGASWPVQLRVTPVSPGPFTATVYVRTTSDTSLIAQAVGLKARVYATVPASRPAFVALLAGALLGAAAWALRRTLRPEPERR